MLTVESVNELLCLCLGATFLRFRDVFYWQTFNTAMGSVTIAYLVMEEIEE